MSNPTVEKHLAAAAAAAQRGDRAGHRQAIAAIGRVDPDHPQLRNQQGNEALAEGKPDQAADHFRVATRRDPTAAPLWLNLAKAERALGNDAGEREALENILSLDQRHLAGLVRLAQLHERLGEEVAALQRWQGVVALAPFHREAPKEILALFDHARKFVTARTEAVERRVDEAVAALVEGASERDRRRFTAAREAMLGRRPIFVHEPHGFHYPFLPADEFFDRDHFPWLGQLEAATATIRAELEALLASPDPGLYPYVQMEAGLPESKWTALDGNLAWSSLHLWREGERVEAACAKVPKTAALVESLPLARIPGRAPSVFFSILKAGKHIPAHTGVTNSRAIIHLPLIVPGQCEFRVGGETRPWVEGEAFAFDDSIDHEAWNRSDRDRAVLILDTWNPHLSETERAMIQAMFAAADAAGYNPRAG